MTPTLESDSAEAYAVLAPAYDLLTAEYAYGPWLAAIEWLAVRHGLSGRRLLDVGCGTGKSFMPLLDRGFDVTACDISPEMVAAARAKAGGRADVLVADMRRLPMLGEFDLITCIDDAINHLLGPDEVADTLAGLRENLAPGGLLVFDVNTLAAYRGVPDVVVEDDERLLRWRGGLAELDESRGRGRGRHRRLHPRRRRAVAALTQPPAPPSPPGRGHPRARRAGGARGRRRPRSAPGRRARRVARRAGAPQGRLCHATRGEVGMIWGP